jgi:hypothetical protein
MRGAGDMSRFTGNATGRTMAETLAKAAGHLSDKAMPKATVREAGRRFSPRPKPAAPGKDKPEADTSE